MKITMDGKYQTRDGRAVRILCTERRGYVNGVVGLITSEGEEDVAIWTPEGIYCHCDKEEPRDLSNNNLVPVPAKRDGWVVIGDGEWLYGQYIQSGPDQTERIFANEHRRHIFWEE